MMIEDLIQFPHSTILCTEQYGADQRKSINIAQIPYNFKTETQQTEVERNKLTVYSGAEENISFQKVWANDLETDP